ncbi:hypothetical protein GCM10027174_01950 [Salinifilum aidingensis]
MATTRRKGSRLVKAAGLALAGVCAFGAAACDDTMPGQDGDQDTRYQERPGEQQQDQEGGQQDQEGGQQDQEGGQGDGQQQDGDQQGDQDDQREREDG